MITRLIEYYSVMMAYYNAKGDVTKSDFFQKRIKHLLSLKQVDQELQNTVRRSNLGFGGNRPPIPHTLEHKRQVSTMINQSYLDTRIKDRLVDKDLKLQESRIENR